MIRSKWLLILLLLVGAPNAHADEPTPTELEARQGHVLVGGKIPGSRDETQLEIDTAADRPAWMNAVHIDKKSGFAVRRSLRLGEHDVILGVKGPILKKKRLGLSIELRF